MSRKSRQESSKVFKNAKRISIILQEMAHILRPYKISDEDIDKISSLLYTALAIKAESENNLQDVE